jgi:hypothetical protein
MGFNNFHVFNTLKRDQIPFLQIRQKPLKKKKTGIFWGGEKQLKDFCRTGLLSLTLFLILRIGPALDINPFC